MATAELQVGYIPSYKRTPLYRHNGRVPKI